jgi:hypothetical protein
MTPFASVAMLEKLALLKIAALKRTAFSSTASRALAQWVAAAPPGRDGPHGGWFFCLSHCDSSSTADAPASYRRMTLFWATSFKTEYASCIACTTYT